MKIFTFLLLIAFPLFMAAQQKATIIGKVVSSDKQAAAFADVFLNDKTKVIT